MQKFCSFPDIGQFRTIVKTISDRGQYVGKDENGDPIFDRLKPLPKIKMSGTVKSHGTNAGVTINKEGQIWAQSKSDIITPQNDNAGFARFVEENTSVFKELFSKLPFNEYDYITIFGEWDGKGIQKGVAICDLDKFFVIFDIKRSYNEADKGPNLYADEEEIKTLRSPENRIFNVYDFQTFEIEIDFNQPGLVQNQIIDMTIGVEDECPIGKQFGIQGTGEGIVFRYKAPDGKVYRFKSKGEKHAGKSKVKVLKEVNTEELMRIEELAQKVTPLWRLSQMLEQTFKLNNGGSLDRTKLGDYIKAVIADIQKEDSDIIEESGLELKDIGKRVSHISKMYFFEQEIF